VKHTLETNQDSSHNDAFLSTLQPTATKSQREEMQGPFQPIQETGRRKSKGTCALILLP